MGSYKEIKGDLIKLAKEGKFDVIAHGCNCFNKMGAGIAVQFAEVFGADRFEKEHPNYYGDIHKLGTIDYEILYKSKWDGSFVRQSHVEYKEDESEFALEVVNAYTQYQYHLDYEALRLCLRKINNTFGRRFFQSSKIGLPQIGCGLAGGNWDIVKSIIKEELKEMDVTVVIYDK